MNFKLLKSLKYLVVISIIGILSIFMVNIIIGNTIKYNKNIKSRNIDQDGPYVFYDNDSILNVSYIKGNKKSGMYVDKSYYDINSNINLDCFYPLDSTSFNISLSHKISRQPVKYDNVNKIITVSDIEGNYNTFRNFLINNKVINKNLNWIFGKGHLVLLGDFIDRGYFSTQILWFIYKLEQEAEKKGGKVHFILGNHEIMNMQGDNRYSVSKYNIISAILEKQQLELYNSNSFLGRWMASKNTIELINGNLFVHGGIDPKLLKLGINLREINEFIKKNYYRRYYPKRNDSDLERLLLSPKNSPYWYRGYFKNSVSQKDINQILTYFNAKKIIVGHTVQPKVRKLYNNKLIAIDVKHPQDHYKYFPKRKSQGLLIDKNEGYFQINCNGKINKI